MKYYYPKVSGSGGYEQHSDESENIESPKQKQDNAPINPVLKAKDMEKFFLSQEESKKKELVKKGPIFRFTKKEITDGQEQETEKEYISIAGIELEVNTEGEGTLFKEEEFDDFSLDEGSIALLKTYATGIKLNQPALVEGETDIGKTRVIEYLSYLTNNRLKRISLSGQTDVLEFIGQMVPNTENARRSFENTLAQRETLKKESLEIITKAEEEGRGLTEIDSKKIAEIEGLELKNALWIWQDGMAPQAMTFNNGKGCWLYFDELGFAEPQILGKLNRVFERYGRLELSENGGKLIEAGPSFRLLASTNPPEYAGRMPFAPDFLRRFVYQKTGSLDAKTLKARTAFIFRREKIEPPEDIYHFPSRAPIRLREHPKISELLEDALIEFHQAARHAVEAGIAKDQAQQFRYEFSDLIRVRDYLEKMQESDLLETLEKAVEFYYMGKLGSERAKNELKEVFKETLSLKQTEKKLKELLNTAAATPRTNLAPGTPEDESPENELKEELEENEEELGSNEFYAVFNEGLDKHGNKGFINKIPGRKAVVLDKYDPVIPRPNQEFKVKVIKDTHPGEYKGILVVKIIDKSPFQKIKEKKALHELEFGGNYPHSDIRDLTKEELEEKFGYNPEIDNRAHSLTGEIIKDYVSLWKKKSEKIKPPQNRKAEEKEEMKEKGFVFLTNTPETKESENEIKTRIIKWQKKDSPEREITPGDLIIEKRAYNTSGKIILEYLSVWIKEKKI